MKTGQTTKEAGTKDNKKLEQRRSKMAAEAPMLEREAKRLQRERMRKPHTMSEEGRAAIAAASLKRLRDPALAEQRRQSALKMWETRRANKRKSDEKEV